MNVNGKDAMVKAESKGKDLKSLVMRMSGQIKNALPSNITPERMVRIAITAISKDPKLETCTSDSFLGALLTSAQLGLECNTPLGQAYLIPYYNNKKHCFEAQFQIGYQGILELCYRTNQYKAIQARIVYEGDVFEYEYGLEENLIHKPMGRSEKPIAVYAYYQLINGAKAFEVMTWDQVLAHKEKYCKAEYSPWNSDVEAMAKKTLLKKVLKFAPKTVEVAEGINSDSAIITAKTVNENGKESIFKNFDFSPEKAEVIETVEKSEPEKTENLAKTAMENKENNPDSNTLNLSKEEEAEIDRVFEKKQMSFTEDVF